MSVTGDAETALRRENERLLLRIAELERRLGALATSSLQDSDVRQSEQAAREATGKYLRIANCIPDTLWSIDLSGRFTYVSPGVERTFGWTPEECMDLNYRDFVGPEEAVKIGLILEEELKKAAAPQCDRNLVRTFERELLRKDGTTLWAEVNASFTWSEDGTPIGCTGVTRDITERKQAETEREKLRLQLAHAQKMESIGRLAGGIAHDFNNLLTVITGYANLGLARLRTGDPLRDQMDEIRKAGERAAGLTRQLLAFSRKQLLQPRILSLNSVVGDMQSFLQRLLGEDVEVLFSPCTQDLTVCADPHQLEQVIMNLVVNSKDAMPGGGRLLIETSLVERDESYARLHPEARPGRYALLAVSDTGVGMDEVTRQRIFEPFFTTKEAGKGTGLGLSMVQGIVAQSGGHINVYSELGQGTTFKIYLPRLTEAATDVEKPAAPAELRGKETILVVEDQEEVRRLAVAALEAYGYRVIEAPDAEAALMICEKESVRIHLVLTDVVMPQMNGRKLVDRLAKVRPGIKALFMSGYTDNAILHHGVLGGGTEFIEKPFAPEELAGKIRAVLGPPAPRPRILVADDEAGVRGFVRAVLEQGGYEVIEAADGRQALQGVRAGQVAVVITDLAMPEQEGLETIQALRREAPGAGIIAISGAFGGQFLKTAQLLGADAVLSKPVNPELLLAKVSEAMVLRR
ncbi:MAG: response regulator [Bryobacteraceae bacterium]